MELMGEQGILFFVHTLGGTLAGPWNSKYESITLLPVKSRFEFKDIVNKSDQNLSIFNTKCIGTEALILSQLRLLKTLAKSTKLLIIANCNYHRAIQRIKCLYMMD